MTDPLGVSVSDDQIANMENRLLQGLLGCRTVEAVEASVTYAAFLSSVGITPDNYPIFLKMLEIENHWVIDSLIGERDPFVFLSPVQPDNYIVSRLFVMLTRWQRGNIYHKNLLTILGVLQVFFGSPKVGYQIYPLSIQDLNALSKHLDREKGQSDSVNRTILQILAKLSGLEGEKNSEMEEIAIHASAIRDAFFDDRKRMEDVIPPVLLVRTEGRKETRPRKRVSPVEKSGKQVAVVMVEEPKAKAGPQQSE